MRFSITTNLISYIKSKKSISLAFYFWLLFVIDDDKIKINWVICTSTINFCKTFHCCCENSIFCYSLIVMSNWLREIEFVKIDFWLMKLLTIWLIELLIFWLIEMSTNELIDELTIELTKLLTMTRFIKSWLLARVSIDEKIMKFAKKNRDLNLTRVRFKTSKKKSKTFYL